MAIITHVALLCGAPMVALALPVVTATMLSPLVQLMAEGPTNFVRRAGGVQWVTLAAVLSFSAITHLLTAPSTSVAGVHGGPGAGYVFFVIIMMCDAMQFTFGKAVGKTPLPPEISPNKTIGGVIGGVVVAVVLGALLFVVVLALPAWQGALVGAGLAALGLAGDLVVSGWKRDVGVKDSGAVIPGQGGLFDRCDSILFAAPLYVWLMTWVLV